MVKLNEKLYINKGEERKCFAHPHNKRKLIKIEYNNAIGRDQNRLDEYYYKYFKKKNISYKHIPKFYGKIRTNLGIGVLFDKVCNFDGGFIHI